MSRYSWQKIKPVHSCKGCCHYYSGNHSTHPTNGYNPLPYCHRFEDIGESCDPLSFKCYEKKQRVLLGNKGD